jgi:uncharacterized protein YyaL (SSP411 family)
LTTDIENSVQVEKTLLERAVDSWKSKFDRELGGRKGYPKFPMPANHDFLLYYGHIKNDNVVLDFVNTTLKRMARGGIYDQAGGGFARYSVDEKWKVPHFEKMLYDNGQLISLYSKGYQLFKKTEYKNVVYETARFIERELMDDSGAFYSSLDADSEGEEGKFYVWNKKELTEILADDFDLFSRYYNINSNGFWEQGNYILLREKSDEEFAKINKISPEKLEKKVALWKKIILQNRSKRKRPGLDDKTLTSWNALVIQGLTDAYKAFNDEYFLSLAKKNALFLKKNVIKRKSRLFHTWKDGKASVDGYLEDYALLMKAFVSLFEISGEKLWLDEAKGLLEYTLKHFYNIETGLFYYGEKNKNSLLTNHYQNEDNVIPAANSVMANNLHKFFLMLGEPGYFEMAKKMLQHITKQFQKYPMAYSNWGTLMLKITEPYYEVVVSGKEAKDKTNNLQRNFYPNILWAFSVNKSKISILRDRYVNNETLIYVCRGGSCQMPVKTVEEAKEMIKNWDRKS